MFLSVALLSESWEVTKLGLTHPFFQDELPLLGAAAAGAGHVPGHRGGEGLDLRHPQQEDGPLPGEHWDGFRRYPEVARWVDHSNKHSMIFRVHFIFTMLKWRTHETYSPQNEWMVRIKRLQLGASLPHLGVSKVCLIGALPRKVWANTHYNCWQWGYWRPHNSLDTSAVSVNCKVFGLPWIEVCVILRSGLNRLRLLIPLAEAKATWPEMAVEQARLAHQLNSKN